MGIRGELFTTEVTLDNRTYFFNIKENRTGDVFLQVVESKNAEGAGFDRHAIVVFEDDMQRFLQGLESSLSFIEKNRKAKVKEGKTRSESSKKRVVRHAEPRSDARDKRPSAETAKAAPRRVKIIPKKKST